MKTGSTVAEWPAKTSKDDDQDSDASAEIITTNHIENGEPRTKRRKAQRKRPAEERSASIANLLVSEDGQHAVATTGEDKSVYVFRMDSRGQLEHLSQRRMTKRPCAIALTGDGKDILVGDKFGDVYALPLQYSASDPKLPEANGIEKQPEPFKPTATSLTVHSGRNLKALESQQRQAEASMIKAREKGEMAFDHELLLGHVSMLTDVITAKDPDSSLNREYIITADRDEHIRVSRGRPQSHIIERYCFGHTQFVSKLCMATPDVLVSGGGDDFLLVWSWPECRPLTRLNFGEALEIAFEDSPLPRMVTDSVTVSGLWASELDGRSVTINCTLEGMGAIFFFELDVDTRRPDICSTRTFGQHNVLDMVDFKEGGRDEFIFSQDVSRPINTKELGDLESEIDNPRLIGFHPRGSYDDRERGKEMDKEDKVASQDLFYGLAKLRKRGNDDE